MQQYPATLTGKGTTETRPAAQDSDTRSLHPFPAPLLGATQRGPRIKRTALRAAKKLVGTPAFAFDVRAPLRSVEKRRRAGRSEARRVGKEGVSNGKSRWAPEQKKKKY